MDHYRANRSNLTHCLEVGRMMMVVVVVVVVYVVVVVVVVVVVPMCSSITPTPTHGMK